MIKEVVHKTSGAILFKADPDTLRLEELNKLYRELVEKVNSLEKQVNELKSENK